jgi:protein-disulfide isomerase
VVIQEFSDFQCPFCSRVNPTVAKVMEEYGNKVQIVWRDYPLPFHKEAHPAAQAAREVFEQKGNKAFWAYHDLLFANQKALTRENLEKYAEQVGGIDMKAFKAALDSGKHKAAVDADMAAVTKAGARIGTPSFFINGKLLQGAQPYPAFKAAIDEALAAK